MSDLLLHFRPSQPSYRSENGVPSFQLPSAFLGNGEPVERVPVLGAMSGTASDLLNERPDLENTLLDALEYSIIDIMCNVKTNRRSLPLHLNESAHQRPGVPKSMRRTWRAQLKVLLEQRVMSRRARFSDREISSDQFAAMPVMSLMSHAAQQEQGFQKPVALQNTATQAQSSGN